MNAGFGKTTTLIFREVPRYFSKVMENHISTALQQRGSVEKEYRFIYKHATTPTVLKHVASVKFSEYRVFKKIK